MYDWSIPLSNFAMVVPSGSIFGVKQKYSQFYLRTPHYSAQQVEFFYVVINGNLVERCMVGRICALLNTDIFTGFPWKKPLNESWGSCSSWVSKVSDSHKLWNFLHSIFSFCFPKFSLKCVKVETGHTYLGRAFLSNSLGEISQH